MSTADAVLKPLSPRCRLGARGWAARLRRDGRKRPVGPQAHPPAGSTDIAMPNIIREDRSQATHTPPTKRAGRQVRGRGRFLASRSRSTLANSGQHLEHPQ
jgi:hypothetical protein